MMTTSNKVYILLKKGVSNDNLHHVHIMGVYDNPAKAQDRANYWNNIVQEVKMDALYERLHSHELECDWPSCEICVKLDEDIFEAESNLYWWSVEGYETQ